MSTPLSTTPPSAPAGDSPLLVQKVNDFCVAEVRLTSLLDPLQLAAMGNHLDYLIDREDQRRIVLDFEKVEYLSSQALGIIMSAQKRLKAADGKLVLCGVNPKLMELLKITKLDRALTIKPTQKEAVKVV